MGCVHEEVCKFYDNGGCKNECEKTVPAKKFEPFDFVIHVPDEGRLMQLKARLYLADVSVNGFRRNKIEEKYAFYDENGTIASQLHDKAKAMGIIE